MISFSADLTLILDSWTTDRGHLVINFVVSTTTELLFYKSIKTGSESHTGLNIFNLVCTVDEDI